MNEFVFKNLSPQDQADLNAAAAKLEGSSFAMTLAAKVGMPVEALLRFLPQSAQNSVGTAVDKALQQCMRAALAMGKGGSGSRGSKRRHVLATAATGAVGGFFGLPGLAFELPVTTTVMLHSIAGIAAREGEDLSQPESALACLEVLALGPERERGEALESAYYATRAALAQVTRDAAAYVAQKGLAKEGAPVLISFLAVRAGGEREGRGAVDSGGRRGGRTGVECDVYQPLPAAGGGAFHRSAAGAEVWDGVRAGAV
jgi:hypothetical protein